MDGVFCFHCRVLFTGDILNRKSLLFVATRIVCRYQTIKEMTIDEFSFNEYIHGYNDIYRINNSNYNKG